MWFWTPTERSQRCSQKPSRPASAVTDDEGVVGQAEASFGGGDFAEHRVAIASAHHGLETWALAQADGEGEASIARA